MNVSNDPDISPAGRQATPTGLDKGKGKRRAATVSSPPSNNEYNPNGSYFDQGGSERTPLLPTNRPPTLPSTPPYSTGPNLRRKLTTVFLTTLTITFFFFIALALLAWSYAARAAHIDPNEIINKYFTFRGPEWVDVLNVTMHGPGGNAGMWLRVQGRMGVDAASAIGVAPEEDDGPIRDIWKSIGRWGVRRVDTVSVRLSSVSVTPADDPTVLAHIEMPSMRVPLSADVDVGDEWLTKVQFPVFISPTKNTTALVHFLRESWRMGYIVVRAEVGEVVVRPGTVRRIDYVGWKGKFMSRLTNIKTGVKVKIPPIPGLPTPGKHNPLPSPSSLVTLLNFSVETSNNAISLSATASAMNLLPPTLNTSFTVPSLPFIVSLPSGSPPSVSPTIKSPTTALPIASVHTLPLPLPPPTEPPTNLTVHLSGTLLPIHPSTFPHLSTFLTRYLSGYPNTVLVSPSLPPSLPFSFPDIPLEFPAPKPKPKLLRDVTIKNMHIKATPRGDGFLASGVVYAKVVFPPGVDVDVDVWRVLPDVLVFDGEVPEDAGVDDEDGESETPSVSVKQAQWSKKKHVPPPSPPLPNPLPERAFGHIKPEDWLPSISEPVEVGDGERGKAYVVTAQVVDVPLEVLPGRNKEFREFVGKVIFSSSGALAGILGTAAVTVDVHGLPIEGGNRDGRGTEIELAGLPFKGAVRVGKKGMSLRGSYLDF